MYSLSFIRLIQDRSHLFVLRELRDILINLTQILIQSSLLLVDSYLCHLWMSRKLVTRPWLPCRILKLRVQLHPLILCRF
jgi:hypothetical protein